MNPNMTNRYHQQTWQSPPNNPQSYYYWKQSGAKGKGFHNP